ncbi:DNA-binding GntR family transcriptional regulator [Curtobacterium sp. AB7]
MESKPASVLKAIRAEIIAGTLARGPRLKEDALAERFGVSRVPVREALRQLETEGFVESEKFKGVRVADSSTEVVIELMQIRRGLEVLAAELAARRQGGECADLLRAVGHEKRSDQEVEAAHSPLFAFHGLVARASGNSRLETWSYRRSGAWSRGRSRRTSTRRNSARSSPDAHPAGPGTTRSPCSTRSGSARRTSPSRPG